MCAPSRPSPPPAPAPTPTPQPEKKDNTARRVGKNIRGGSPAQRGRGVLIRSRNPLGIASDNSARLGTRRSLLTAIPSPLNIEIGY